MCFCSQRDAVRTRNVRYQDTLGRHGWEPDTVKEIYGTWNTATLQVLTISPGCSLILGE